MIGRQVQMRVIFVQNNFMTEKKVSFWRIFWPALTAAVIVSLIGWIITIAVIGGLMGEEPEPKDRTVLHLTLSGKIGETSNASINGTSLTVDKTTGLSDLLYGFEQAADDKAVKGIFLDLNNVSCGYATAHELRNAIAKFRKSGKFVVAYLSGEVVTQKQYYISSAANEVYGFPTSAMEFMGLGSEMMYFKRTFDMVGVEMQVIRGSNNDFKSAVEPFFREDMSDSSRVQVERFLSSIWLDMREDIAKDRKITAQSLNDVAEYAKIQRVEDALKFKMIDGCKYRDEVVTLLHKKAGKKVELGELMSFEKYARDKFKVDQTAKARELNNANVAVVVAEGSITVDGDEMASRNICKYFQEIRRSKKIKTVVFRINSGGGSALASEEIWREVTLTAKKMNVVVSMGDVAASGGYYIATPASVIFAERTTITGSIGVFGVIPFTGKLFEDKLGITFDRAQTNAHAVLSTNRKLSESELALIQGEVDQIYSQFKKRVADGRGLTTEQVEVIARGRVWTGADAIKIGLVDKIGGLSDAIAYAVKKAKIKDAEIRYWPSADNSALAGFIDAIGDDENAQLKMTRSAKLPAELTEAYENLLKLDELSGIQMRLPFIMTIR